MPNGYKQNIQPTKTKNKNYHEQQRTSNGELRQQHVSDSSGGNLKRASGNGREVPSNKDFDLKMKIKG
jgi:hypothetical protein